MTLESPSAQISAQIDGDRRNPEGIPELASDLLYTRASISRAVSPPEVPSKPARRQRNSRDRTSDCIKYHQAKNLIEAAWYAPEKGLPLNRFVTIHWECAGIHSDFQGCTGRFLKLAGDWLGLRNGAFAWVWIREGGEHSGDHVHILMHVPPELVLFFSHRQRGWIKACGGTCRKGVIKTKPIGRNYRHALCGIQHGRDYRDDLARLLNYVLKEADADAHTRFNLTRSKPSSVIIGKRSATSQNIGRAARRRATPARITNLPNSSEISIRAPGSCWETEHLHMLSPSTWPHV